MGFFFEDVEGTKLSAGNVGCRAPCLTAVEQGNKRDRAAGPSIAHTRLDEKCARVCLLHEATGWDPFWSLFVESQNINDRMSHPGGQKDTFLANLLARLNQAHER